MLNVQHVRFILPQDLWHLFSASHGDCCIELEDNGAEIIGLLEDFEDGGRELHPNFFDGFDSNPGRHLRARRRNGMIAPSEGSSSDSDDDEGGFSFYLRSSDPWARIIGLSPSQLSHSESERV